MAPVACEPSPSMPAASDESEPEAIDQFPRPPPRPFPLEGMTEGDVVRNVAQRCTRHERPFLRVPRREGAQLVHADTARGAGPGEEFRDPVRREGAEILVIADTDRIASAQVVESLQSAAELSEGPVQIERIARHAPERSRPLHRIAKD